MTNLTVKNGCRKTYGPIVTILLGTVLGLLSSLVFAFGGLPYITALHVPGIGIGLLIPILIIGLVPRVGHSRHTLYPHVPVTLFASLAQMTASLFALGYNLNPCRIISILIVFIAATLFFISLIGLFALLVSALKPGISENG